MLYEVITMMWRGFECAGVEKELSGVEGVVVGRVLSVVRNNFV